MQNGLWKKGLVIGIIISFIVSGILTITPVMKADLTDGLIGYWSFNNGNANDESGNGHDGIVYGATVVDGKSGTAFSFDGDDDYIDLGDEPDFDITGDITISLWFKTSTAQMGSIISKLDNINPDFGYDLAIGDSFTTDPNGQILFRVANDSNGPSQYDAVQTTNTYTDDAWHLLTAIYTPDGVSRPKIYIDAIEQSVSNSGTPLTSIGVAPGYHLKIAEYSPEGGFFNFNGVLDEIRIYSRALAEDEIQELFIPSTVYVDDDFTSSTPGWGYDHFSSIQAGIDAIDFNGTIFVSSGIYYENLLIEKNYLKILSENKNTTIIDASGVGNVITIQNQFDYEYNGKYNIISGFTIRNAGGTGVYIHDVGRHGPPHPGFNTISDCLIYGCTGSGIYSNSDHEDVGDQSFLNCKIFNNSGYGLEFIGRYQNRDTISGCQIYNNQQGGIYLGGSAYDWGYSGQHIVRNNSCYNNNGIGISITPDNFGNIIYHNNFYNNTQNAYDYGSDALWFNTILQEGNYWSDYTGEDNNSDGIGDTPYNISGGSNQDSYPFMQQNGWLLPQPPNQPPMADAGGPYYANVNNAIIFNGSGSSDTDGTIIGYRWDFTNDGNYDTGWLTSATTTHNYPSVGTYTVKLEVKDNASGTDTDTATVTITSESGAIPTADVNGPYIGYVNYSIAFSSSGSNGGSGGTITSYYWTFGDGDVSSLQNPLHKYTATGIFTVTLKVTNNFGQIDNDTTTATISQLSPNQTPPVADAGGPYSGVVDSPITFNGSGSIDADGTIVSYVWNFGDSTTGTGVSPIHTYTIAGNYTVILTVTDNESLTHSNSTLANINVSGPPTIVISIDISNIEPVEEQNEKTIPVTVYCYHQIVSNIHLEILQSSNLTVTLLSPNITLNPGESRELLIKVKAPKLVIPKKSNAKVGDETIILRAVGDGNVISNTEQINIKVIQKGATPGFELVLVLSAIIVALFLWRKKRSV